MAWTIKIRPLAYIDLDKIAEWYNLQRGGLGGDFLREFDQYIAKLQVDPNRYFIIFQSVRRLALKKFPYKVLFIVNTDQNEVVILGVVHYKRSNSYLRRYYK